MRSFYAYTVLNNVSEARDLRGIDKLLAKASNNNPDVEERERMKANLNGLRASLESRDRKEAKIQAKRLARKSKVVRSGRP